MNTNKDNVHWLGVEEAFARELARTPLPDVVDCTGVTLCNDDLVSERGEANQDSANTLPIYPKPEDLPHV